MQRDVGFDGLVIVDARDGETEQTMEVGWAHQPTTFRLHVECKQSGGVVAHDRLLLGCGHSVEKAVDHRT